MFKRLLLAIAAATLLAVQPASASAKSAYRDLAQQYLTKAVDFAREVYTNATAANSTEARLAYFYSLYSKYYGQVRDQLEALGYTSLADVYDTYASQLAALAQTYGLSAWLKSAAATSPTAYLSYLYNYLGYLYTYLARFQP
jgi:hypothetical protein